MFIFRVDSSTQIGSGHLMRCLTLADQMKNAYDQIVFISRHLEGNINFLVIERGYTLIELPLNGHKKDLIGYEKWLTLKQEDDAGQVLKVLSKWNVECLVVDHYALDIKWEKLMRPYVKRLFVIDDLANRQHDCDALLDQNYYCDMEKRYAGLVPLYCKMLLGPQYALLREEFYEERKHLRVRDGIIRRIFVFFGGSDLTNETMKAVRAIAAIGRTDIQVDVVVGASNKQKEEVENFCQQHKYMKYYCQVSSMAELMHKADLAIGAGGTTTWERCFLGLPTIVIAIAHNQIKICEDSEVWGFIYYLGSNNKVDYKKIQNAVEKLLQDKKQLLSIGKKALECMGQRKRAECNEYFIFRK